MGSLTADLFISLDGFASGDDVGPFFGYQGPELDRWIEEHLDETSQVILGRRTYEALARISAASDDRALTELPKLVVSNTLQEPLEWDNSRLLSGDAAERIEELKRQTQAGLRTMGSLTLVRSLLAAGVVDRLRLTVFPLILGPRGSEPVFAGLATRRLSLVGTEVLDDRVVVLEYAASAA